MRHESVLQVQRRTARMPSLHPRFSTTPSYHVSDGKSETNARKSFQNPSDRPKNKSQDTESPVKMRMPLIAHHQATTVVHPGKGALDAPALGIDEEIEGKMTLFGTRLSGAGGALASAGVERNDRGDPTPSQRSSEGGTGKTFVGHHPTGTLTRTPASLRHPHRIHQGVGGLVLPLLRRMQRHRQRQAVAIADYPQPRAVAPPAPPGSSTPFLAGTKLPSRNACAHSSLPCASNCPNNVCQIRSHVPSASHCCNRRQQVAYAPYARGRSAQAHPVLSTYRMPLSVCRSLARGLPRPRRRFGSSGSITAHWSSVNSCLLIPLFYFFHLIFEIASCQ